MKDYSTYAGGSISMSKDKLFIQTLESIFQDRKIYYILESGTYLGTGSSRTIADLIVKNSVPIKAFYTIEVDHNFFRKARRNLSRYDFVEPIWGLSVDPDEAVKFIESDEAITNHEKFPDVFIDTLVKPAEFYTNEIRGQLSQATGSAGFLDRVRSLFNKEKATFRTNVFQDLLPKIADTRPLILLDSAGGIGLLEFKTVLEYLSGKPFTLILDDIHHLKHFRSLAQIESSRDFRIINKSQKDGWVIADYLS